MHDFFADAAPHTIVFADNLSALREIPDGSFPLIYLDPPFNTGRRQARERIQVRQSEQGERRGFGGRRYETIRLASRTLSYADVFSDYLLWLEPRLREAHRLLSPRGTLYLHLDPREVHYAKVLLDLIFGRESFQNEVIWAYDYGARTRKRWPWKHDNLLVYARDPGHFTFNYEALDRIPYLAPGLVGKEKAARGKTVTDTWWGTIVPTMGREKTGYPTQKPLWLLRRILSASSHPGEPVLDFFAGSGTTGAAAMELGRRSYLVDNNPDALQVMGERFRERRDVEWQVSGEWSALWRGQQGIGEGGEDDSSLLSAAQEKQEEPLRAGRAPAERERAGAGNP